MSKAVQPTIFSLVYSLTDEAKKLKINFNRPRSGDCGYDLYSTHNCMIVKGESVLINTGIRVKLPTGHVGLVLDRSSVAGNDVFITAGVIDSSYRGIIYVRLNNAIRNEPYIVRMGDKIAQLVITQMFDSEPFEMADEKEFLKVFKTKRNESGFGSTGK